MNPSPARPERPWQEFSGDVAWPTVLLLLGILTSAVVSGWGLLSGQMHPALAFAMATVNAYLAFTVAHEACHGNIHGKQQQWHWLNELCGWIASVFFLSSFPAFRVIHLQHHSHTNDPNMDPDHWVVGGNLFSILFRCITLVLHYQVIFLFGSTSKTLPAQRVKRKVIVSQLALFTAAIVVGIAIGPEAWGVLLIGPLLTAGMLLGLAFDWIPHVPHQERKRFLDTRVIDIPVLSLLFMWQNYHLMHHLFPRVPFYRKRSVFLSYRQVLDDKGAHIVTLGSMLRGNNAAPAAE